MTTTKQKSLNTLSLVTGHAVVHALMLAISSMISFWLITHILVTLYSVSRADDLLGGMWAVVATIFVYRYSQAENLGAALSRIVATLASFALCLAYLLIFPFHVWGMAVLIGVGAIAVAMMGRPDEIITTSITTTVVMVVAAMDPHAAWRQPILRLIDTAIGVVVGVAAGSLCGSSIARRPKS